VGTQATFGPDQKELARKQGYFKKRTGRGKKKRERRGRQRRKEFFLAELGTRGGGGWWNKGQIKIKENDPSLAGKIEGWERLMTGEKKGKVKRMDEKT